MSANNENNPNINEIDLGAITADADVYGLFLPKKSKILRAYLKNGATLAASDTDFLAVSLQLGSTVIAELDTRAAHENGLTANVPKAMNVVAAAQEVDAGSYLKAVYDESGTIAMTSGKLIVEWCAL